MKLSFSQHVFLFVIAFLSCDMLAEHQEHAVDILEAALVPDQEHLPTGRHVIADLKGCAFCHYKDDIEAVLREAATRASATVLDIRIEKFSPIEVNGHMVQGMTGMVILSESHIAFHTWPENGFVACDIFTCGTNALPEKGLEVIIEYFQPQETHIRVLGRGMAAEA